MSETAPPPPPPPLSCTYSSIPVAPPQPPKDFTFKIPPSHYIPPPPPLPGGKAIKKSKKLSPRKVNPVTPWNCLICLETFQEQAGLTCPNNHSLCFQCSEKYFFTCRAEGKKFQCVECAHPHGQNEYEKFLPQEMKNLIKNEETLKMAKEDDLIFRCENSFCTGIVIGQLISPTQVQLSCPCCQQKSTLGKKDLKKYKKIHSKKDQTLEQKLDAFYLSRKTLPCPHCHKVIERSEGCPHMTCVCGGHWCWTCGGKYKNGRLTGSHHSKWKLNGCPNNLFPNKPVLCTVTRGAALVGGATAAITLGPPILLTGLVLVGIPFAVVKGISKLRE